MALAFVGEIEELAEEFAAALFFVEFDRLQHRPVEFHKAVAAGHGAPRFEDVVSARAVVGIEVAEAREQLHRGRKAEAGRVGKGASRCRRADQRTSAAVGWATGAGPLYFRLKDFIATPR